MAGNSRNKSQRHDGGNQTDAYSQETQNQRGLEEKKRRSYHPSAQSDPNSYQQSYYMGEAESIDLAEDNWREWD